jgi:asparagine synthase (glutamine-hydrolysing)
VCGLAGVVQFGAGALDPVIEVRGDAALAHRGPDGHGCFWSADRRSVLMHRRLAIIDPSAASDQPMADVTGRWHLVYNGEIYNYKELRAELTRDGVRFATSGDTELLLQLLVHRGPGALRAARGMFAFALWDAREQSLLVARDRFGIKPLYVARDHERVCFASELRALNAVRRDAAVIAPSAVLSFLRWGSVLPPLSWFGRVEALEPGTWRRWSRDGSETGGRFACLSWGAPDAALPEPGDESVVREIGKAIEDSVAAHLVSDVPVALFLSGGLDSAMLLATASALGHRLACFTVADTIDTEEAAAAQATAAAFGASWRALRVDRETVRRAIPEAVQRLDQPTIDGPNAWVIASAVAREGVKTALSGTGGDELFGGYPSSRLIPLWSRLGALRSPSARGLALMERARHRPGRAARLAHVAASADFRERYRAVRGFFLPPELSRLAGPRLLDDAAASACAQLDAIEARLLPTCDEAAAVAVARAETQLYLRSQLLRDLDVMSMAHGLEVRVPLVDHALLAATWPRIAHHPKLLARKNVLRRILSSHVPRGVLSRRKTGFTLPFDGWLRAELRGFARAGIDASERSGWIAPGAGERVWSEWESGRHHWSRPWGLAVLGHQVTPQ